MCVCGVGIVFNYNTETNKIEVHKERREYVNNVAHGGYVCFFCYSLGDSEELYCWCYDLFFDEANPNLPEK